MLEDRLIVESGTRPSAGLDDERRRYYDVSHLGRQVAAAEIARMQQMVQEGRVRRLIPREESAS
jgi:hypothetical protein